MADNGNSMTHDKKLLVLKLSNLLFSILAVVYMSMTGEWWWLWVTLVTYFLVCIFGNSIGYHRLITHRSFTTHRYIRRVLLFMGVLTCSGSPMSWAATHRTHHKTSDTDKDPHSPYNLGFWRSVLDPSTWNHEYITTMCIRDLYRDKDVVFVDKYYFKIIVAWALILLAIDYKLFLFIYAIPSFLVPTILAFTIQWTHWHGYRNHETTDESRNNPMVSWILFGEGWHNNHHNAANKWNNKERWWEFDPPAAIIRLIKK